MRLDCVLFDMNGTLLDPTTIDRVLGRAGSDALAGRALADAVTHSMAVTLAGDYRPFAEILEAVLARALAAERDPDACLRKAMEAAGRLEPYPDAAGALEQLSSARLRTAVLTNSARTSAEKNLAAIGLRDRFDAVIGTDDVEAFKPDLRVYRHAASLLEVDVGECCLVTAHEWDLLGAAGAGFRTAWVSRTERKALGTIPRPDFQADDLLEITAALSAAA